MLRHIENKECHNQWTIQHLNALAEESNRSAHFIIPGRGTYFRAGAPPLKPMNTDHEPYQDVYVCSICGEDYGRKSQLKRHLQNRECSHDHPSVLRCPSCPDYGFQRPSELSEHFERQGCQYGETQVTNLLKSLERNLEDPRVQWRLDKDLSRLRAHESKPGRLRVDTRVLDNDEVRRLRKAKLVS